MLNKIATITSTKLGDVCDKHLNNNYFVIRRLGSEHVGIILGVGSANERRRYHVTPPLIGYAHTRKNPWYAECTSYFFFITNTPPSSSISPPNATKLHLKAKAITDKFPMGTLLW